MNSRVLLPAIVGSVVILASMPVWFITLMAVIAGRSWSLATGLAGIIMLAGGVFFLYMAYTATRQEKMGDARYHNMERQVLALAKKNNGSVTVADLINVGIESAEAEKVLDRMAKKGICDINLDATQQTGITTYSFPTLIPFEQDEKTAKVL